MINTRVARSPVRSCLLTLSRWSVLALVWLLAARADASLVMALDTNELAKRADHIAVADVLSVESAWDEGHHKIYTTIELSVVESWKGGALPAARLTIVQPGGTVGDVAMVVFGLSNFAAGERTLVFLRGKATAASVVGMSQGKRAMRRDTGTGKWTIDRADHAGLSRVPARISSSGTPVPLVADNADGPCSLDEMRVRIRELLKAKQ
jgi:hypothetical protein